MGTDDSTDPYDSEIFVAFDDPWPKRPDGDDPGPVPNRRMRWVAGAILLVIGVAVLAIAGSGRLRDDEPTQRAATPAEGGGDRAADATTGAARSDRGATTTIDRSGNSEKPRRQWPAYVKGRPDELGSGDAPPPTDAGSLPDGFYLWNDFYGWHLWIVGGSGVDASVEIRSDDLFSKSDATGGSPFIEVDANALRFGRGDAGEPVVGVDFNPGYYAKTLVVTTTGDLPTYVGPGARKVSPYLGLQYNRAN